MAAGALQRGISVIVCCHNSATRLPQTLEHLARQRLPDEFTWEVIVVDNASTDDTAGVARSLSSRFSGRTVLRVVDEPTAGLSFARQCGIRAARFECTVFCDDDNWLCENYLHGAVMALERNANVGIGGGVGRPAVQGAVPAWFEKYQVAYAVGPQSDQAGYTDNLIYGAGMIVRTAVLQRAYELGFASQLTGRKGKTLTAGEDGEINVWISALGYRSWYAPELQFEHQLERVRLTRQYLKKMFRGFGISDVTLGIYNNVLRGRRALSTWQAQVALGLLRLIGSLIPQRHRAVSVMWTRRQAAVAWLVTNRSRYYAQREAVREMVRLALRERRK